MDYCIYREIDNGNPETAFVFTQKGTHRKAKAAARAKLDEILLRLTTMTSRFHNIVEGKDEISYQYRWSNGTVQTVRYYLAPFKKKL